MTKETIALNPTNKPKNNQQFMTPKLPYWKQTLTCRKSRQDEKEGA